MPLIKMTEADFLSFGLVSENDLNLDKETGNFENKDWSFQYEDIIDNKFKYIRKYTSSSNAIYLVSNKTLITNGYRYPKYEFYKEV